MKKVLLVGDFTSSAESMDEMLRFLNETLGGDFAITLTYLESLVFSMAPGEFAIYDAHNQQDITGYDVIFMRGPTLRRMSECAYALSRYCTYHGIPFLNDYSMYYSGTKVAQTTVFLEEQVPFLKTTYSADQSALVAYAEQTFGYPYILKAIAGSHGNSNYLVRSREQAEQIITDESDKKFLAQAFCPNDRDYRVLLVGDSHLIFERKGTDGSHLNNTSKGGEASLADGVLPDEIIEQSRQVSRRLGLTIAGIDVMPHLQDGTYYFLEVNSQPQLRTGALLEEKQALLRQLFGS
jgi:glutathione synthase/RimK-type ligase-like ATP-grasp enzyme